MQIWIKNMKQKRTQNLIDQLKLTTIFVSIAMWSALKIMQLNWIQCMPGFKNLDWIQCMHCQGCNGVMRHNASIERRARKCGCEFCLNKTLWQSCPTHATLTPMAGQDGQCMKFCFLASDSFYLEYKDKADIYFEGHCHSASFVQISLK